MATRVVHSERKKMRRVHNRRSGPMHFPVQELKRLAIVSAAWIAFSGSPPASAAEKSTATGLIELARTAGPGLRDAITSTFDAKDLKDGTAWAGDASDFFFAIQTPAKSELRN